MTTSTDTTLAIGLPGPRAARTRPAQADRVSRRPDGTLLALLALYGCWGAATPAMKLMVRTVPPLAGAGVVFVLGALAGRSVSRGSLARLTLGFAGVATVLATAPHATFGGSGWALVAACVAPMLWAAGTLIQAGEGTMPSDPRTASAISLAAGGVALLVLAGVTGQLSPGAVGAVSVPSLGAAAALLVLDSLAGFSLYTRLLRTAPAPLVSTYAYVVPLVAVAIGVGAFGDHLWPGAVAGGAVVLVTIMLEVRRRRA